MEFCRRDERALDYGKSSLDTGDTLVILHPEDYKPLDPTGFPLNKEVRVHSRRLIATDSKKFEKIFSPEIQRTAREFYYPDGFPKGIDFILDLRLVAPTNLEDSPFAEDISEQLIAELKCSKGIRSWFSSQQRCGISQSLVGGLDAVAVSTHSRPSTATSSASPRTLTNNDLPASNGKSLLQYLADQKINNNDITFHADMLEALKASTHDSGNPHRAEESLGQLSTGFEFGVNTFEDFPEYCPVRYRVGIEHLLQIIEGREPKWLDSALKVWTLYVVAKYFECTHYVTDRIFAWMLAPKNEIFIEVLPETSLQMGFGLQNSVMTRAAFAILASEEALRISSCDSFADIPRGVLDIHETRFIRAREILDDMHTKMVEQAGEQLYVKVKHTWQDLSAPNMSWLKDLPEWNKISRLKNSIASIDDKVVIRDLEHVIETLEHDLIQFVRGPIIRCLYESLPFSQISIADNHRRLQQYNGAYCNNFKIIYDTLTNQERTMTRFFWKIVSELRISEQSWVNWHCFERTYNPLAANPFEGRDDWIANEHNLQKIETHVLQRHVKDFNVESDLKFPLDAPEGYNDERKFNLSDFFAQVRRHVLAVCDEMLDKGELDWANTTDTVLCLSEAEYGLLPSWEEREVEIEEPEYDIKEKCELTDASDWDGSGDWDGADEGSMSDWDLIDD